MPHTTTYRALLAGVLAGALTLGGCSIQELVPGQAPESLPPLATGGGAILSSQGSHEPEAPPSSSSTPEPEPEQESSQEDTPSFAELPSSSQAQLPSSSSSSTSAPPPSSSQAPPSSSSSAPPVSSSQSASSQPEPEEPEDPEEEEAPSTTTRPRPASSGSSVPEPEPEAPSEPDEPEEQNEPDEPDEPEENASGWQDLRVRSGGETVSGSAVSIVARIVQNEVGTTYPEEAIKAQAVAAYTFVRYHNNTGSTPSVILSGTASEKVTRLVKEVAGEQITYNGQPILASYCAMSAGWTASSRSVWGRSLPYLTPVDSDVDEEEPSFRKSTMISQKTVKSKLESALKVNLAGIAPDDWLEIQSYCDDTGLYVDEVLVGGTKTTTGRNLRENVLGLRSTAFEVRYDPGAESFEFITRGYGHGVGMSQVGAKRLAGLGWDHVSILEHYYSGAEVTSA